MNCKESADGVVAAPAHSKSEYKRRVAQGDPSVLPPAGGVIASDGGKQCAEK